MRPQSIVYFEWLNFGMLAAGAIQSYLNWDQLIAPTRVGGVNPGFVLTVLIFIIVITGALTLLVSRRRSKIAMWVFVAMFTLGWASSGSNIASGSQLGAAPFSVLQTICEIVAIGLLFTPSSRNWMNNRQAALRTSGAPDGRETGHGA